MHIGRKRAVTQSSASVHTVFIILPWLLKPRTLTTWKTSWICYFRTLFSLQKIQDYSREKAVCLWICHPTCNILSLETDMPHIPHRWLQARHFLYTHNFIKPLERMCEGKNRVRRGMRKNTPLSHHNFLRSCWKFLQWIPLSCQWMIHLAFAFYGLVPLNVHTCSCCAALSEPYGHVLSCHEDKN